jgi:hypothetical protein
MQRITSAVRARISVILALVLFLPCLGAFAGVESTLRQYVGYTIVGVLTIVGWRDSDGSSGTDFKGCQYGRVIIFEGNQALKCTGYGYQYAYRPDAVILVKGGQFKMLVESDVYDMQN